MGSCGPTPGVDREGLAARWLGPVRAFARRRAKGCPEMADALADKATDALVWAIGEFRPGPGRDDFGPLLWRTVRKAVREAAINWARKNRFRGPAPVPLIDGADSDRPRPATNALSAESVGVLTPEERAAVEAIFCDGLTLREAGGRLGGFGRPRRGWPAGRRPSGSGTGGGRGAVAPPRKARTTNRTGCDCGRVRRTAAAAA
jgi:DNA-directed RNA polymerase specialized sigma24 family protein